MAKSIISEGKTKQEAIEKGLKAINLPKELCEIKVLNDNKKSFFDILAPTIVKVEIKEIEAKKPEKMEINATEEELNNARNNIEEFLKEFFEKAKINAKIKIEIKDKCIYVTINGENIGNLIGYRGDALYALENLLKAVANKNSENRIIVRLDIEDYKQKREETLKEFALKKAAIVEKTGKTMTLEPMKAYERKIIHTVLQENSKVETRSIGEEPKRRIVITKKEN